MRAIWKGAITFGLVNVPVSLHSATQSHDVSLHQVHDADGGRIRYQRKCEVCREVVPYEHIDKAYVDGETTVVLTGEDLDSLPAERSREIDVIEFVPSEQLDPLMFEGAYYLAPNSASSKSYVLLRETLQQTDRVAIVSFALRHKTRLGALRVKDEVLVLQTMLWPDEVREASFGSLDEEVTVSEKELAMSAALVAGFESDFDPAAHHDDYQDQLRSLIEAKLDQGDAVQVEVPGEDDDSTEVLDLMEALRRSVEQTRARRAQENSDSASGSSEEEADAGAGSTKSAATSGAKARKSAATTSSRSTGRSGAKKEKKSA